MTTSAPYSPADHPTMTVTLRDLRVHADTDPKAAAVRSDILGAIRHLAGKRADLEDRADRIGLEQARAAYFVRVSRNRDHASSVLQMGAKRAEVEIAGCIGDITHGCNSVQCLLQDARRLCPGITSGDLDAFRLDCAAWINGLQADAGIRVSFAAGLTLGDAGAEAVRKAVDKAAGGNFAPAAITCYRLAAAAADGLNRENAKLTPDPEVVRAGELLVSSLVALAKESELCDINMLQARGPKVVEMVRTAGFR